VTDLRILHLYPRELGINGDAGNVLALAERARWRGFTAEVLTHDPGDDLPDSVDLVHIGSGPLTAQRAVHDDVLRIAATLRRWRDAGVPVLAIAAGWQLLGEELSTPDGEVLEGAGVFPTRATLGTRRHVAEVLATPRDTALCSAALAGFENHSATTTLAEGAAPLATLVRGQGNGDGTEGVIAGSAIGSNLHGPLLPMNPSLADHLLRNALDAALPSDPRIERVDGYAARARSAIAERLGVSL
jgi:CobQ-like glutamine amidotransferase family enzyme